MATGPIQRAATHRVEQIGGLGPKDQVRGLRGFRFNDQEPLHHTPGKVQKVIMPRQGRLSPPGSNNFDNHA